MIISEAWSPKAQGTKEKHNLQNHKISTSCILKKYGKSIVFFLYLFTLTGLLDTTTFKTKQYLQIYYQGYK